MVLNDKHSKALIRLKGDQNQGGYYEDTSTFWRMCDCSVACLGRWRECRDDEGPPYSVGTSEKGKCRPSNGETYRRRDTRRKTNSTSKTLPATAYGGRRG